MILFRSRNYALMDFSGTLFRRITSGPESAVPVLLGHWKYMKNNMKLSGKPSLIIPNIP
jgi:hypothetical protein